MYNILANLKNGGEPQKSNKINASLHSPPFSFLIIHIKSISTAYSQNCCQRCFIFSHSNSPQPLIYRGFPSFPTSSRMDSRLDVFLSNILRFHNGGEDNCHCKGNKNKIWRLHLEKIMIPGHIPISVRLFYSCIFFFVESNFPFA